MLQCESLKPSNPVGFLETVLSALQRVPSTSSASLAPPHHTLLPLFVFDTETTGLSSKTESIIEIGCVEMRVGGDPRLGNDGDANAPKSHADGYRTCEVCHDINTRPRQQLTHDLTHYGITNRVFHCLCKPFTPIQPRAGAVHGITMAMLKDEGSVEDGIRGFVKYMCDPQADADAYFGFTNAHHTNSRNGAEITPSTPERKNEATADSPTHQEADGDTTICSVPASPSVALAMELGRLSIAGNRHREDLMRRATGRTRNTRLFACTLAAASDGTSPFPFVLCGHNVAFDVRMLQSNSERFGLDVSGGEGGLGFNPASLPSLCTVVLMKQLYGPKALNSFTLDSCCDFYGINRNMSAAERCSIGDYRLKGDRNQHSALTDAYATATLFEKMLEHALVAVGAMRREGEGGVGAPQVGLGARTVSALQCPSESASSSSAAAPSSTAPATTTTTPVARDVSATGTTAPLAATSVGGGASVGSLRAVGMLSATSVSPNDGSADTPTSPLQGAATTSPLLPHAKLSDSMKARMAAAVAAASDASSPAN